MRHAQGRVPGDKSKGTLLTLGLCSLIVICHGALRVWSWTLPPFRQRRQSCGVTSLSLVRRQAYGVSSQSRLADESLDPIPDGQYTRSGLRNAVVGDHVADIFGLNMSQFEKVAGYWRIAGGIDAPHESQCVRIADYLQGKEVGLSRQQVGIIVEDCPAVLNVFSVETLREKVRFLEEEVQVPASSLPDVLVAYPQVFARSIPETLRPALEFWVGTVGVPRADMEILLKHMPAQVWCKPQTMRPKWRFAEEVLGLTYKDLLASTTPFFRLSLDKTIAPRHFFALQQSRKLGGLNLQGLVIDEILGSSDKKFCKRVAKCEVEEYRSWLLDEWPFSEEARTVAWIKPRPRPAANERWSRGRQRRKF